ncbi:MAG: c-type cytochrome [Sphingomicrobium sp.]
MRFASITVPALCVSLVACGGSGASQANNSQANISDAARTGTAAQPATVQNASAPVDLRAVMHERHEGMETIGKSNKAIKREFDGGSPDLATIRGSAAKIADLSQKASLWFPAGTGPELGKTGAKPDIWQNPQDFAAKLHNFQVAAKAFSAATGGNDVNAIKSKFADLGGTCKACHDKYRSEMHH